MCQVGPPSLLMSFEITHYFQPYFSFNLKYVWLLTASYLTLFLIERAIDSFLTYSDGNTTRYSNMCNIIIIIIIIIIISVFVCVCDFLQLCYLVYFIHIGLLKLHYSIHFKYIRLLSASKFYLNFIRLSDVFYIHILAQITEWPVETNSKH
jgi:hypothetical protein